MSLGSGLSATLQHSANSSHPIVRAMLRRSRLRSTNSSDALTEDSFSIATEESENVLCDFCVYGLFTILWSIR